MIYALINAYCILLVEELIDNRQLPLADVDIVQNNNYIDVP